MEDFISFLTLNMAKKYTDKALERSSTSVVYVSSEEQSGEYNIRKAIENSIEEIINSDIKNGALLSIIQPFHDGERMLLGSGFIVDHGDEIWSGSITFTVPTEITSINVVGSYDFQYITETSQLAIEKKITNTEFNSLLVTLKQKGIID